MYIHTYVYLQSNNGPQPLPHRRKMVVLLQNWIHTAMFLIYSFTNFTLIFSEARSSSECIKCFCFGRATRCHSADLFTYNMPTPLGEGGTRLLGVALSGDGAVRTDNSIVNHYFFSAIRNGATVSEEYNITKLFR